MSVLPTSKCNKLVKNDNYMTDDWVEDVMHSLFENTRVLYQEVMLIKYGTAIAWMAIGYNNILLRVSEFSSRGIRFLNWCYLPVSFLSAVKGMKGVITDPTHVRPWLSSAQKTADFVSTAFYTVGALCMKKTLGKVYGIGIDSVKNTIEAVVIAADLAVAVAPEEQTENEQVMNQSVIDNFQETRTLNILKLARAVASVVLDVFIVLAFVGIWTWYTPIISYFLLGIACTAVILSITAHFYEKCMEFKPAEVNY